VLAHRAKGESLWLSLDATACWNIGVGVAGMFCSLSSLARRPPHHSPTEKQATAFEPGTIGLRSGSLIAV
jgi:hypothetical protein